MFDFLLSVALGGVISFIIVWLLFRCRELYFENEKLLAMKRNDVLQDLDLATSEQLLSELRRRPSIACMILTPCKTSGGSNSIEMQTFNIPAIAAAQMLTMATKMTIEDLKKQGINYSDLPYGSFPKWSASLFQEEDDDDSIC